MECRGSSRRRTSIRPSPSGSGAGGQSIREGRGDPVASERSALARTGRRCGRVGGVPCVDRGLALSKTRPARQRHLLRDCIERWGSGGRERKSRGPRQALWCPSIWWRTRSRLLRHGSTSTATKLSALADSGRIGGARLVGARLPGRSRRPRLGAPRQPRRPRERDAFCQSGPEGGSPTDMPSGPIVFIDRLVPATP